MNKNWPGWRSKTIRRKFLSALSDDEIAALVSHWGFWARPDQLPPAGEWTSWMMLGGRGAGKTRAGAEWVRARVERKKHPARFIALIGETYAAARAFLVFDGDSWQPLQGATQQPALVKQVTTETAIAQSETPVQLAEIPSHSIFLGLSVLVLEDITGVTSWRLGVAGDGDNRFGNGLSVAAGAEIRGPADPSLIYWQPTPVFATPEGGRFTGGRVLVSVFYIEMPIPVPPSDG